MITFNKTQDSVLPKVYLRDDGQTVGQSRAVTEPIFVFTDTGNILNDYKVLYRVCLTLL